MSDKTPADMQSREVETEELHLFESWLERATLKLADVSANRVRNETRAHVQKLMRDNLSEVSSVTILGDPTQANNLYRQRYLSDKDSKFIRNSFGPHKRRPRDIFIICMAIVAATSFGIAASIWFGLFFGVLVLFDKWCRARFRKAKREQTESVASLFKRCILVQTTLILTAMLPIVPKLFPIILEYPTALGGIPMLPHIGMWIGFSGCCLAIYISCVRPLHYISNAEDAVAIIKRAWEDET